MLHTLGGFGLAISEPPPRAGQPSPYPTALLACAGPSCSAPGRRILRLERGITPLAITKWTVLVDTVNLLGPRRLRLPQNRNRCGFPLRLQRGTGPNDVERARVVVAPELVRVFDCSAEVLRSAALRLP